jgi:hypothetical protein
VWKAQLTFDEEFHILPFRVNRHDRIRPCFRLEELLGDRKSPFVIPDEVEGERWVCRIVQWSESGSCDAWWR